MDAFRSMSIPPDKYPGLPVRTTQTVMGQKIVMTIDSAQEMDLPDTDFAIPGDYKELLTRLWAVRRIVQRQNSGVAGDEKLQNTEKSDFSQEFEWLA